MRRMGVWPPKPGQFFGFPQANVASQTGLYITDRDLISGLVGAGIVLLAPRAFGLYRRARRGIF